MKDIILLCLINCSLLISGTGQGGSPDLSFGENGIALWDNFCINERLKYNTINKQTKGFYFWRTYDQAEVDLIEEYDGQLDLFEFKYNPKKSNGRFPNSILQAYPIRKKL